MAFKKSYPVSDETLNTHGFWIPLPGMSIEQAKRNCPAFYDHATWEIPLGHWENLRVESDGKLWADLVIDGKSEKEKEYIRKIENGDIKGASIGADPLEWSDDPSMLKDGQTRRTLTKCELFEISITPLPGNKNALALKTKDGFVKLSTATSSFIPDLNTPPDMKKIALKLGLQESATEEAILDALVAVQLKANNADAMHTVITENVASQLPDEHKDFFVQLSKTDVPSAMKFLNLNKKADESAEEVIAEVAEPLKPVTGKATLKKDVTLSQLIQQGKQRSGGNADDGKDTFDYLQKHNSVELSRIRKEDPPKYAELAKAYGDGVRYTGSGK